MTFLHTFLDIAMDEHTPLATTILTSTAPLVAAPLSRGAAPPSRPQGKDDLR